MDIIELKTELQFTKAFPVIKQLRKHLTLEGYLELVRLAEKRNNYKMFGLMVEDKIMAVIGYIPMVTLYGGKYIWVCDLVTDKSQRSKGYGERLLRYVENKVEAEGYEGIELSSGVQRKSAHHFYEDKLEYNKASYIFRKRF